MLPFKSFIELKKDSDTPIYIQIANSLIIHIKKGVIQPKTKLPGTRTLAVLLGVHRKTVIAAFDELFAQGWIQFIPSKGTYVSERIPESTPDKLQANYQIKYPSKTGFMFKKNELLHKPILKAGQILGFNDGFPDVRLAPLEALMRNYRNVTNRGGFQKSNLSYADTQGNEFLRKELAEYLQQSRGLQIQKENIFITRGSQMGVYLLANALLEKGDKVVVGETNYFVANITFQNAGATLLKIPVDEWGVQVEALEEICQKHTIRMLFITPHHHYPTTVTLCADRRVHLLQLAEKYGFIILEDDYDYDFHYSSNPILPLASADTNGMVVYVGSLCKTIAPAIRIGYIVAPENLIDELGYLRRIMDRQGDNLLEQAVGELFKDGEIKRHLKKALKAYHQRRDFFCALLSEKLNDVIDFQIPQGGMAVWANFDKSISLPELSRRALHKNFLLNNGLNHNPDNAQLNATRLGFASLTISEIEQSVEQLLELVRSEKNK